MKKFVIILLWIVFCFFMVHGEYPTKKDTIPKKVIDPAKMERQINVQISKLDSLLLIKKDTSKIYFTH